jgi:non-ribosomal peptide synthetase component F
MSYAELDARANQLAHRLIGLGVGREVPVGVMMPRSLDLVVALLGVLKAGGAYVPMDPSYPADRLAMIIEDSEVRGRPLVDGRMRGPVSSKVASARRHLCC